MILMNEKNPSIYVNTEKVCYYNFTTRSIFFVFSSMDSEEVHQTEWYFDTIDDCKDAIKNIENFFLTQNKLQMV